MTPQRLVANLESLSFNFVFNPYCDVCSVYDQVDAPLRRSQSLLWILEAASAVEVDAIWIGRDLGYRGGRRTGLALTDDLHVDLHARRWGLKGSRATIGPAVAERTAAVIWKLLAQIQSPIFLWNVFPLHPHAPGDSFSNRPHNSNERRVGEEILRDILSLLRPRRIIAIGNDAALSARRVASKEETIQVRHPSYGGQKQFERQMEYLYWT